MTKINLNKSVKAIAAEGKRTDEAREETGRAVIGDVVTLMNATETVDGKETAVASSANAACMLIRDAAMAQDVKIHETTILQRAALGALLNTVENDAKLKDRLDTNLRGVQDGFGAPITLRQALPLLAQTNTKNVTISGKPIAGLKISAAVSAYAKGENIAGLIGKALKAAPVTPDKGDTGKGQTVKDGALSGMTEKQVLAALRAWVTAHAEPTDAVDAIRAGVEEIASDVYEHADDAA